MKGGRGWPVAVITVLALTVAGNLWVMRIASHDPSFAIEPDYYRQAVQWDSTLAQERRNRALGWDVRPAIREFTPGHGGTLEVRISAPDGSEIRGAEVRVIAFAVARAANRVERVVPPTADGARYSVRLPVAHGGAWELRFEIRKDNSRLTATRRVELASGTDARAGGS